jgi:hypothetical protein
VTSATARKWAVGASLMLVAGVFFSLGKWSNHPTSIPRAMPKGHPGPTYVLNEVPLGYAHSSEGAVIAARNFSIVLGGTLTGSKESYLTAVRSVVTEKTAERALASSERLLREYDSEYGSAVPHIIDPLFYRVLTYSPVNATIEVWSVSVGSFEPRPPTATWATQTFRLEWENDDWHVADIRLRFGPVPELEHSSEEARNSDGTLTGFSIYDPNQFVW